jgi:hypothetical protein
MVCTGLLFISVRKRKYSPKCSSCISSQEENFNYIYIHFCKLYLRLTKCYMALLLIHEAWCKGMNMSVFVRYDGTMNNNVNR